MSLSIIIVTHQSASVICRCLEALGPWRAQALVVDNASHDGTADRVREMGVRLLALRRNLGFGRAANRGVRETAGPFLCFLNPDTEATPALFELGLRALAGQPRRCVVPALVEPDGHVVPGLQPGYTRRKLWADMLESNGGPRRLWHWLTRGAGHHDRDWTWPHGACLFLAREFFQELGGFDTRYFLYMEDVDLGWRIHQAGGGIVALDYQLRHAGCGGSAVASARRRRLLNQGRLTYATQHYGIGFATLLRMAMWSARFTL